jgi:hypothetical protein
LIKRKLTINALNRIIDGNTDGIYIERLLRFIEVENSREVKVSAKTVAKMETELAESFALGIYF